MTINCSDKPCYIVKVHVYWEVARKAYKKGAIIMTEENNIETTETENIEQVDTQEPTVKVAEMKRRIEAERTKAQEQIEELNKSMEQRIAEEVKKAQEVAQLNGKELEEYKQKEQQKKYEDEIAKRDAELEKLRQENLQRTIRD